MSCKLLSGPQVTMFIWLCSWLLGCGTDKPGHLTPLGQAGISGHAHGGQQPLAGASVQLYAVSSNGDGTPSPALLNTPALTDAAGGFSMTSYTCPAGNPFVYLVARGGNPGLAGGTKNNAAGLMAVLGPCQSVSASTYVQMNELTTVASVWSLAPFMSSYKAVGSGAADAEQLANGVASANQLVNMATGEAPGTSLPAGASVPVAVLNTLANLIAACINSPGGHSGDGSVCGNLFALATNNGVPPTNTVDAMLNIAGHPSTNTSAQFQLISSYTVFGPGLSSPPASWSLPVSVPAPVTAQTFPLVGLLSPATVAQSIFVLSPAIPTGATVSYLLDDQVASTESAPPFWMGGQSSGVPFGFSLRLLSPGTHTLRAVATLPDGSLSASASPVTLNVVPSINAIFSSTLKPYADHVSAQESSLATIMGHVTTPGATLSSTELTTRQQVLTMYMNWGIDPSLDYGNDESTVLANLAPTGWASPGPVTPSTPASMLFSTDAPYYQPIPTAWPRVQLPTGYIKTFQLNTVSGGDGIGFGQVTSRATDPSLNVRSEWYTQVSTLKVFSFRMPLNWSASLPWQTGGDMHMIFVDKTSNSFVSSYKTSLDPISCGPDALYASSPTPLGTLGVTGGSNAANFADLPVMLQPGEAVNPSSPIPHAVGGPVGRTWAARVFPASGRDANILTSTNSCTGTGYTNTGLVPYGGLIQLDPTLDLTKLSLTLPALRILQAMQTYGYYVMDFGCSDLDIYTAISETELDPYGGLYGNANGIGVQNEIRNVLLANRLYVVPPLTTKQ